jgi:ParB family transcriptional regulator, chromosome partitioning protein
LTAPKTKTKPKTQQAKVAPWGASAVTYELLDPDQITVRNIRQAVPSKQLIDSIGEHGVRQPIGVLRTADGELVLRFGDRRRQACAELGFLVPALVVEGTAGTTGAEIERIFGQLDENDNRQDLTVAERVLAVEALFSLGTSATVIARKTGLGKEDLAAARKAAASETARTLAAQYPLTLDQAAAIAEFDDDPETAARLAETARDEPGQFAYSVQEARDDREDAAAVAAHAAGLAEQGITVVAERPNYQNNNRDWAGPDGKKLTWETHKNCPGHVVFLDAYGRSSDKRVQESWFCTDPKGNGHRKFTYTGAPEKTPEETAAERRRVIDGNKAWRTATTVRQRWVRDVLLQRKTIPDHAALFTAQALAGADSFLIRAFSNMSGGTHATARELLGGIGKNTYSGNGKWVSPLLESLNGVSEQRAQVVTLALVIGAYEYITAEAVTWRTPSPASREYLATLDGWGYHPSAIELAVINGTKNAIADHASADGEDSHDDSAEPGDGD